MNLAKTTNNYHQYLLGDHQVPPTCPNVAEESKKSWYIDNWLQKVLKSFSHWDALIVYFSTKQLWINSLYSWFFCNHSLKVMMIQFCSDENSAKLISGLYFCCYFAIATPLFSQITRLRGILPPQTNEPQYLHIFTQPRRMMMMTNLCQVLTQPNYHLSSKTFRVYHKLCWPIKSFCGSQTFLNSQWPSVAFYEYCWLTKLS